MEDQSKPLLQIVADNLNSAPKVIYQGRAIGPLIDIDYQWKTRDSNDLYGKHQIVIHYLSKDGIEVTIGNRKFPYVNDSSHSIARLGLDIDCSSALKGLKALQRETRKTAQVMKALSKVEPEFMVTNDGKVKSKRSDDEPMKSVSELVKPASDDDDA